MRAMKHLLQASFHQIYTLSLMSAVAHLEAIHYVVLHFRIVTDRESSKWRNILGSISMA